MFKFLITRKAPKDTLGALVREDLLGNSRVPDKATRDKIFGIVKALFVGERKGSRTELKKEFTSLSSILSIWAPAILFIVALGIAFIYNKEWFGKPEWMRQAALWSVLGIYGSFVLGQLASIFTTITGTLNMLPYTTDRAMKNADSNAQHVIAFYEYESEDLRYVLVQLKAERAIWKRRVSMIVGQIEKVGLLGMIPGVAAAITIYMNPNSLASPWIHEIANALIYGTPALYVIGCVHHMLMVRFDKGIMLLEMVIEVKKSEQSSQDTTKLLIQVNEPHKTRSRYLPELKSWENSTDR
jgi:hypothetical protein